MEEDGHETEGKNGGAEEALSEKEIERTVELLEEAWRWHEAQIARRYLDAFEEAAVAKHGVIISGSELDRWLRWARERIDWLDPLTAAEDLEGFES